MVEGHTVSNDGTEWNLRLREGLRFHDDTPVLARDVDAKAPSTCWIEVAIARDWDGVPLIMPPRRRW